MDPAGTGPPPLPHMPAGSPTNTGTSSDEIAQRFAGFFFRVVATEPEKVHLFYDQFSVRSHLMCSRPPPTSHDHFAGLNHDPPARDDTRWRMDGKRAEGTTKIYALINSLREEGLVLTLEAVYSHGQADGSVLVAAVGLVGRVNRRLEGSVDSSDFDDDEEDDDGDVPATFVEVFVLKQKAGMGGYFVTDDMLHLLSGPLEPMSEPRSPSVCRQKLRETLEQLHEARMARTETEEELRLLQSHVTSSGMEIQMLRQSLEEAQAENEAKTAELQDMTAHVSEVEAHAAASERELIADLTAKQNMTVQHMDERLSSLKDQLQHSSRTRDELRESVDALQSQLTESRAECRAHKEEVDKLRNQSASLQKEVAQLKMRVTAQAAADESHGLRRRIEELQQEVKSARCALEHAETMSEQKLQRQKNLIRQTFETLTQRTNELHVCKKERDSAVERLQKQMTVVYRLEREKELAKNELKTCRLSLKEKDKNRELPRELDAADDARSSKSERSRVRGSPTAHEQQQQQKQTTDLLLEEKRALEAQTAELARQLEDAQEGLKGREQELQAVRDTMLRQLENLEQARDAAQEHARKLEVMMSEQAKAHEEIVDGKARAEDQLLQMRRDMDMLSHHLQEARATASGKEADARAACQDAQSAQRDVSLWKDKYETSQLQVLQKEVKGLRQRVATLTNDLDKALRDRRETEEMLNVAQESIADQQAYTATVKARYEQQLLEVQDDASEARKNLEAEVKYLRQERMMYLGEDRT